MRRRAAGLALAALVFLAGCNPGPRTGEVAGKVTFGGKPVQEGIVSFQSDAGEGDEAPLNAEGAYAVKKPMPVGDYKVLVLPLVERKQASPKEAPAGVEKPAPDIPRRVRTIGTTDLKAVVKEGKNEINFELKR